MRSMMRLFRRDRAAQAERRAGGNCEMQRAAADFAFSMGMRIAARTQRLKVWLLDDYRPELHYMRGPGPKWRAKHGQQPVPDLGNLAGLGKAGA
jgi:hypothetical protein